MLFPPILHPRSNLLPQNFFQNQNTEWPSRPADFAFQLLGNVSSNITKSTYRHSAHFTGLSQGDKMRNTLQGTGAPLQHWPLRKVPTCTSECQTELRWLYRAALMRDRGTHKSKPVSLRPQEKCIEKKKESSGGTLEVKRNTGFILLRYKNLCPLIAPWWGQMRTSRRGLRTAGCQTQRACDVSTNRDNQ